MSSIGKIELNPVLSWLQKNKFYSTTPIGGFTLIENSKFKWEIFIWYVVLFGFGCLTIVNVTDVVSEYVQKKTVTTVNVKDIDNQEEKMFSLPPFYVKVTIPSEYFFKDNNGETGTNSDELWRVRFEESNRLLKICNRTDYNDSWKPEILYVLLLQVKKRLAEMRNEIDLDHSPLPNDTESLIMNCAKFYNLPSTPIYVKFTKDLVQFLFKDKSNAENNSLFYLFENNLVKIESFFKMTQTLPNASEVEVLLHIKFDEKQNITSVYIDFSEEISGIVGREPSIYIYDQSKGRQSGVDFKEMLEINVKTVWETKIACDEDMKSYEKCVDACRAAAMNIIGCSNDQWNLHLGGHTWCPQQYARKRNHSQNETVQQSYMKCFDDCWHTKPCKKIVYSYSRIAYEHDHPKSHMFLMTLKNRFSVVYYEQERRTSYTNFLAELGGTMDLWIGASVIGFVHMFIYFIKQFIYASSGKTKTGTHIRKMFRSLDARAALAPAAITLGAAKVSMEQPFDSMLQAVKDGYAVGKQKALVEEFISLMQVLEKKNDQLTKRVTRVSKRCHRLEAKQKGNPLISTAAAKLRKYSTRYFNKP